MEHRLNCAKWGNPDEIHNNCFLLMRREQKKSDFGSIPICFLLCYYYFFCRQNMLVFSHVVGKSEKIHSFMIITTVQFFKSSCWLVNKLIIQDLLCAPYFLFGWQTHHNKLAGRDFGTDKKNTHTITGKILSVDISN